MTCAHHFRRVGSGKRGDSTTDCERPNVFQCVYCLDVRTSACSTGREDRCAYCATIKRGDLRAIGRSGAVTPGVLHFLTLSAPGADLLGWDTDRCTHGPELKCSGFLGCVVDRVALAAWHATVAKRWSYFRQFLRRAGIDVQYFKTYELQKRGALHVHAMVRVPAGVSDRLLRQLVRSYARSYGWGRQYDLQRLGVEGSSSTVQRAAAYCAKYATKGAGVTVERLDFVTGELRSCGLRSWSSSASWGLRMHDCRMARVRFLLGGPGGERAGGSDAGDAGCAEGVALDSYSDFSTLSAGASVPVSVSAAVPV